jgi:hypothetical protein
MPSKESHCHAALENNAALQYLLLRIEDYPQWVVTVAFYKALHIVEAMFAADRKSTKKDTDNHETRNRLLKTERRYQKIWGHYRVLWNDSLVARYLKEGETFDSKNPPFKFLSYVPADKILSQHINHHLHQILESARIILDDPSFLADCNFKATAKQTEQ